MNYKLVNSVEMKEKCRRLDISFSLMNGWCVTDAFMIIEDNKMGTTNSRTDYTNSPFQEIIQADFLALPEPIKVGDWCLIKEPSLVGVLKVIDVNDRDAKLLNFGWTSLSSCTKLTPEQIKILGLEK